MPDSPQAPTPQPKEVRGVTLRDFQHWRHSPVTAWFLRYLADYRADLVAAASEQWLAGQLTLPTADEMKGRVLALGEVATLPFDAIAAFYQAIDQAQTNNATEEDDGSEAAQDDAG